MTTILNVMDRLSRYLNHALILNDCVILPNFGGFVCHNEPAYIDELQGILIPTSKKITFNESLNHKDNLFAKFIAQTERVPLSDAEKRVERYINDIKISLEREEELNIQGIGQFKQEGSLLKFKSEERNFMATTAYLPAVNLPMPSMHINALNDTPEKSESKIKNYILRGAAAVAAIAIIAGAITLGADRVEIFKQNQADKASFEPTFPFFPTTPQVNQCSNVISPECDYLDFISEL